MKKLIFGFVVYFALFAISALVGNAQDVDDGLETETAVTYNSGWYYPTANSRTAMRRCGITEEVIHRMGYTVAVRLSEPLIVDAVEYCINSAQKLSGWTSNLKGRKGQKIVMAPGTLVWADPKDSEYAYAGGCLNKIKAKVTIPAKVAPNPTPTPIPVSTPVPPPMCANRNLTIAQARENGFIIRGDMCELDKPLPPVDVDCPECPKDIQITPYASMKTRWFGGLLQTGISAGAGCATAGLIGKSWEDCLLRGALPSAVAGRAVQLVNPSPDSVRVRADGTTRTFKRGKGGAVSKDCELFWEGNIAVVKCGEQECQRMPLFKNFNMTVIAVGQGSGGTTKTPVKSQPSTSIPSPPRGPNGRILGFDVGGTPNGSGAGSAQPNSAIGFSCPANYTPMILKGERICSPN